LVLNILKISITTKEQYIIKKLLSEQIEKSVGISPPQESYIKNIESGMPLEEARQEFAIHNFKYWDYMTNIKKDPLFCLFMKI